MLAWLVALPCFVCASWITGALQAEPGAVLPKEVLLAILSDIGIADLLQAFAVSKSFCVLARQVVKTLYGIQHNGVIYLNQTKLLYRLDMLLLGAGTCDCMAKARKALQASTEFVCIESMLRAKVGYCIKYADKGLPKFCVQGTLLSGLEDERMLSALPYIIDHSSSDSEWIYLIRGLVDRGHHATLAQLTFANISTGRFYKLMSVAAPEALISAARKALQRAEPTSGLSILLSGAGPGHGAAPWPRSGEVPLFILRDLHEKSVSIPEGLLFVDGLCESSMRFWIYVLGKEVNEAEELLRLVLEHGADEAKCLASAFFGPVPSRVSRYPGRDVLQAVLTRMRFSPLCNAHITQNYDAMLKELPGVHYHTACAFLDSRQSGLAGRYDLSHLCDHQLGSLIGKLHQMEGFQPSLLLRRLAEHYMDAAKLLKHLVQIKADDAYAQLIWDSIQVANRHTDFKDHCCAAPLSALRRLMHEPDISVCMVQKILGTLAGFQWNQASISKEAHALYTAMFWEAPDGIIEYLLAQVSDEAPVYHPSIWQLLVATKYSSGLCWKFLNCLKAETTIWAQVFKFRPDLIKEPDA